jgi:hypothetical protein
MFTMRSAKEREVHLNRILGHSISILDQPSLAKQKIAQLGTERWRERLGALMEREVGRIDGERGWED